MLTDTRVVPVIDLPTTRQLDAAMGLSADPRVPLVSQSGLFVLGLRGSPVPWLAPPLVTTARTLADGAGAAAVAGLTFWALAWGAAAVAGYGWLRRSRA